jgi:PAS domain S-box-containing protein
MPDRERICRRPCLPCACQSASALRKDSVVVRLGNRVKLYPRSLSEFSMNDFPAHQWLCESIVEQSPIAIIVGDRDGIVRLWNTGAEMMFGWSAEEALGNSMDMIIPEKHRPRHWEGYDQVIGTGVTKYGRSLLAVPALTKDGRRISIEFNVVLLKDAEGRVLGIAATMQDVTARWERDKTLRERMAALEGKLKQAGVLPEDKS